MGWSGGTEIFDCVAKNTKYTEAISQHWQEYEYFSRVLKPLIKALEDQDWDTQNESHYWTHPIIGRILGNTFEEEDDE